MTIEEMRGLDALKTYKELEEAKAEIKRLQMTIQRLGESGDAMMSEPCEYTFEQWIKAKEAKP